MRTAITASRVFDGSRNLGQTTVVICDGVIEAIGGPVPHDADVVYAQGATLLPGLIDAHVHTDTAGLRMALQFGVTTELEMQGANTARDRSHISEDDGMADVRSAGFGLTPPGGHPEELFPKDFNPHAGAALAEGRAADKPDRIDPIVRAKVTTPAEAVDVVGQLSRAGSDYIKFMVDDGMVEGHPGLPMLDQATLNAGVAEAHRLGMLTVAHALTIDATRMSIDAGVDGLAHLFMDRPAHAQDHRGDRSVRGVRRGLRRPRRLHDGHHRGAAGRRPAGRLEALGRVGRDAAQQLQPLPTRAIGRRPGNGPALDEAGVDLLIGTDVSQPLPFLGGLAHGASVHQELQYFVDAGISPAKALSAATAVTARRFGLSDRGTIAVGQRADLLLVDGDPTTTISDTLNIRAVWRRGTRLPVS